MNIAIFGQADIQTRYDTIPFDRVAQIVIYRQNPDGTLARKLVTEKTQLHLWIRLIKQIALEPLKSKDRIDKARWVFRIILDGVRDQIFYFRAHAFVGKSAFRIDPASLKPLSQHFKLME